MKSLFPSKYSGLLLLFTILFSLHAGVAQEKFGGLALYTVRDNMNKDARATLKSVADAGYAHIEAAGYENGKFYNMSPSDFSALLRELGLKPVSTHQGSVTLENADQMMTDVKAAGFTYFVIPVPPMGRFYYDNKTDTMGMTGSVEELADILRTLGEKANKAGLQLLYHNHDFEFVENEDGIVPIDYLLENLDPELVNFQMDLFWVTKAGADPLAYFEKYPGRFKIWHVKDMDKQGKFAPVGTGTIDFAKILEHKETAGMQYYMVEQDNTFDLEPLKAIRVSHGNLKAIGFN
ncbi:sugar phosphate isomerase/epimerase family protein [Zeaxanthinibacter enoshimensis]|uniref:Sugar phosphate isomerase/epimerase n=1 Tax=Zeaxanthinibacter enoshimensis TaxID=392009 RepID=A0A4R6TKL1_9FLAO|nr:sugar phosphate isomerase/epimerase [Zeaxanthinibacter enoshimensis]TDQ31366.1 sugar phosphate isomerase/epimerase [Zeaxanthinibacter enoshimensis]